MKTNHAACPEPTPTSTRTRRILRAVPSPPTIPDLLCGEESLRIDPRSAREVLAIAFSTGAPAEAFDRVLCASTLPASSWQPERFEHHLFLSDLVAGPLRPRIAQRDLCPVAPFLTRVLSSPPDDSSVCARRHDVFRELLASPALRADLERSFLALRDLFDQFEAPPMQRWDNGCRRQIEILASARNTLEVFASSFEGARSALASIRSFAATTRASIPYERLTALLAYDNELATLDVRIRIGSDGHVRDLSTLALRENESNHYHQSAIGRLASRVLRVLRGYRFSSDELLARYVMQVFDGLEDTLVTLVQLRGDLEFFLAGLALRDRAHSHGLGVCVPTFGDDARHLAGLFNPLLLGTTKHVVPCDLAGKGPDGTVIVTGPNSGGKTRLVEGVALAQMMAQAGFVVPAREASLRRAHGLFVSLIEQARADHTEGRLGMELTRIRELFEAVHVGDMVVLDELCSGTNPSEGEEIFLLVVTLLAELRPQAYVTTHFLQLAERLRDNPLVDGLDFLQVELDERQWPTFGFVSGVARTSLAQRTAARLGVTREELMALVDRCKRSGKAC